MKDLRFYTQKIIYYMQPLLVFAGVLAAVLGFGTTMQLSLNVSSLIILYLIAGYGLMFLYHYVGKVPGGKWMGLMSVGVLEIVFLMRFFVPVVKGGQYVINSYLKQFIEYTHIKVDLISYIRSEGSFSNEYCTTLFFAAVGVALIAIISFSFYDKRNNLPFLLCTLPLLILPLTVGNTLFYSHTIAYLFVFVIVIGTGLGRQQDEWIRYRVSLILFVSVLCCVLVAIAFMTPAKYEANEKKMLHAKIAAEELMDFSSGDFSDWLKANFGVDAIDYGTVGEKAKVEYNGDTLLKIRSKNGLTGEIFLKGFVGEKFVDNQWEIFGKEDYNYVQNRKNLEKKYNVDPDNWDKRLITQMHQMAKTGLLSPAEQMVYQENVYDITMEIDNVGLGRGNRVLPYYAAVDVKYNEDGKVDLMTGSSYTVNYYSSLAKRLIGTMDYAYKDFCSSYLPQQIKVVDTSNLISSFSLEKFREFIRMYYLDVPEEYKTVFQKFFDEYNGGTPFYVEDSGKYTTEVPEGYVLSDVPMEEVLQNVQKFLAKEASYTLSPGETPEGEDAITYFMTKSKKGYCVHFASAATMLLRLCGVPARYVEGVKVTVPLTTKDVIEVKDSDAHAWVEIYRDDIGWVPMEVTPGTGNVIGDNEAVPTPTPEGSSETPPSEKPAETAAPQETETAPPQEAEGEAVLEGEQTEETPEEEEEMEFDDISEDEETEDNSSSATEKSDESSKPNIVVIVILSIIVIILLLIGQMIVRRAIFRRRLARLDKRNRIIRLFLHLRPLFRAYGVDYRGQASEDYIRLLSETVPCEPEKINTFVTELLKAEFGGRKLSTEEYKLFVKAYRRISRSLLRKMSLPKRILFRLIHG